jgi:hypothetical protein
MGATRSVANLNIPPTARVVIPHGEARIADVEAIAISESLHVITGGSMVILCSEIPIGGARMAIKNRRDFKKR